MAHFVRSFDCKTKNMLCGEEDRGAMAKSISGDKIDIINIVNNNPLPGKPTADDPMNWAYIHFQLCMKYANAVLNCDAFIPTSN